MDREKVIKGLELCEIGSGDRCYETECPYYEQGCTESLKNDILALLKEQEDQIKNRDESLEKARGEIKWLRGMLKEQEAEWVYGEDKTGVDGWHCSECNFFEPWFYDFDDDIDFIKRYEHCPKCGRRMISYTGKQEGR